MSNKILCDGCQSVVNPDGFTAPELKCKCRETCKHEFTRIAPEITEDDPDDCAIWEWCIRCGVLKLDDQIFKSGPHQKLVIVAER